MAPSRGGPSGLLVSCMFLGLLRRGGWAVLLLALTAGDSELAVHPAAGRLGVARLDARELLACSLLLASLSRAFSCSDIHP